MPGLLGTPALEMKENTNWYVRSIKYSGQHISTDYIYYEERQIY